jgi:hypothetical protein
MSNWISLLRSIVIIHFAAFCPAAVALQQDDPAKLAYGIRQLREHSFNCEAAFEIYLETNGEKSSQEWRHWINRDGSVSRTHLTRTYSTNFGERHESRWEYVTKQLCFTHAVTQTSDSGKEPKTIYIAQASPYEDQKRLRIYAVDYLFGFLSLRDIFWDEVLTDTNSKISIRNQAPDAKTLVATLPGTGEFEFTFNLKGDNVTLFEVAFKAAPDDLKDEKWLSAFQFKMNEFRYRDFEGKPLIEGYRLKINQTSRNPDGSAGSAATIDKNVRLVSFERLKEPLTDRISFPGVDLPDGTRVRVLNDPNVPHELRSGMIVRVLPESSVIATKDARFRQPEASSSWWYLTLGFALLALVAVFVYRRWG